MALLRRVLGETLRGQRQRQHRTLREVSAAARVSLGYLSEVERGQKEASSELLGAICDALDLRLSDLLREVSDTLQQAEAAAATPHGLAPIRLPSPAGPAAATERAAAGGADTAAQADPREPATTTNSPAPEPAQVGRAMAARDAATAPQQPAVERPVLDQPVLEPAGGDSREVLDAVMRRLGAAGIIAA